MSSPIVTEALYLGAMIVTAVAGTLVYRQHLTSYRVVRDFLVGVYVATFFLIGLELWRVSGATSQFMQVYAPLSTGLGLAGGVFLSTASVGMYLHPQGSNFRTFVSDLRKSRTHTLLVTLYSVFSISIVGYVATFRPFTVGYVTALGGGQVLALGAPAYYVVLLALMLIFFLSYPTAVLFMATRRIPHKTLSESLLSLPIGWAGVTVMYVVFESLVWVDRLDATGLMYFLNSLIFLFITQNFGHSAVLAGLVAQPAGAPTSVPAGQETTGSTSLGGIPVASLTGRPVLFEADTSLGFEDRIREIASVLLGAGKSVFVFTSRGSRVHQAVSSLEGVKLYLMAANISYYKPGDSENEVLISADNPSVVLDALAKSTGASAEKGTAVIFDSLSDLVLSLGFQPTYKFMKAALEVVAEKGTISVFVMLSGTQEKNVENIIVGRFPVILKNTKSGLLSVKASA